MNDIVICEALPEHAEAIAKVHIKSWQESYQGIIDQKFLNKLSFEKRLESRKKILNDKHADSIHLVVMHNNNIVGFCDAGPIRSAIKSCKGEIYAIYLLNQYKKMGIGSKLIKETRYQLIERNLSPYIVWVLEENKTARQFYEKHGGHSACEKLIQIEKEWYKEIGYVFK